MARPSTVTVPLLVTASGLKGSNEWFSGLVWVSGAAAAARENSSAPVAIKAVCRSKRIIFAPLVLLPGSEHAVAAQLGIETGVFESVGDLQRYITPAGELVGTAGVVEQAALARQN